MIVAGFGFSTRASTASLRDALAKCDTVVDAVATLSANRPEAFLITAASYVMGLRLPWMNPTSSEDDHAYILEDSGVQTLFVDPLSFSDRARVLAQRVPGVSRLAARLAAR